MAGSKKCSDGEMKPSNQEIDISSQHREKFDFLPFKNVEKSCQTGAVSQIDSCDITYYSDSKFICII